MHYFLLCANVCPPSDTCNENKMKCLLFCSDVERRKVIMFLQCSNYYLVARYKIVGPLRLLLLGLLVANLSIPRKT
jgi:hypothetical protein